MRTKDGGSTCVHLCSPEQRKNANNQVFSGQEAQRQGLGGAEWTFFFVSLAFLGDRHGPGQVASGETEVAATLRQAGPQQRGQLQRFRTAGKGLSPPGREGACLRQVRREAKRFRPHAVPKSILAPHFSLPGWEV